jgi:hypothetical protein
METIPEQNQPSPPSTATPAERLAYSIQEAADLLGIHYVLRGKLLVPRVELVKLLQTDLR